VFRQTRLVEEFKNGSYTAKKETSGPESRNCLPSNRVNKPGRVEIRIKFILSSVRLIQDAADEKVPAVDRDNKLAHDQ